VARSIYGSVLAEGKLAMTNPPKYRRMPFIRRHSRTGRFPSTTITLYLRPPVGKLLRFLGGRSSLKNCRVGRFERSIQWCIGGSNCFLAAGTSRWRVAISMRTESACSCYAIYPCLYIETSFHMVMTINRSLILVNLPVKLGPGLFLLMIRWD
jgi:hypothetical protein